MLRVVPWAHLLPGTVLRYKLSVTSCQLQCRSRLQVPSNKASFFPVSFCVLAIVRVPSALQAPKIDFPKQKGPKSNNCWAHCVFPPPPTKFPKCFIVDRSSVPLRNRHSARPPSAGPPKIRSFVSVSLVELWPRFKAMTHPHQRSPNAHFGWSVPLNRGTIPREDTQERLRREGRNVGLPPFWAQT